MRRSRRSSALLACLLGFALAGCTPPADSPTTAKQKVSIETLPWTEAEANQNLKGMTKEEVIELFGKPSRVVDMFYNYDEPKYLKPDIGDRDPTPGGMALKFGDDNTVRRVDFQRR